MTKYKAYPEYKDSGVEWLGEIPKDWKVHSLKRSISCCTNGIWGGDPDEVNDIIVLRVADFDRQSFNVSDVKLTTRSIHPRDRRNRLLKKGDLLIEKSGGGEKTLVGCVVIFDKDYEAVTSNFVAKMSPIEMYDSCFLKFVFSQLYAGKVNYPSIKQTTGIQNLDSDSYLMERFCFPSKAEQINISTFLNHETAKIDSLLEKQQRLIELLKEKRQAVISHAVTKGLNPEASMKDSGLDSVGRVPKDWVVMQLRHAILRIEQGKSPECEARLALDCEWGVLKSGCVNYGIFNQNEHKALPEFTRPHVEYEVHAGDLIMSRASGSTDLIGSVAFVDACRDKLLLSDKTFRLIIKSNVIPEYLSHLMGSQMMRDQIKLAINGAQGLANNITKESIRSFVIAIPKINKQQIIIDYINDKNELFNKIEGELFCSIRLLQERRSALISAAVTGKIDVRDWVAPAASEAATDTASQEVNA